MTRHMTMVALAAALVVAAAGTTEAQPGRRFLRTEPGRLTLRDRRPLRIREPRPLRIRESGPREIREGLLPLRIRESRPLRIRDQAPLRIHDQAPLRIRDQRPLRIRMRDGQLDARRDEMQFRREMIRDRARSFTRRAIRPGTLYMRWD